MEFRILKQMANTQQMAKFLVDCRYLYHYYQYDAYICIKRRYDIKKT